VFNDFNPTQRWQVYAGTSEGFNEIWWFYCSEDSDQNDRYVVFNYVENAWYYGSMARSAWLDTALRKYPIAAQDGALLYHESGNDDGAALGQAASPITAFIESADFDIEDGHNFAFITKVIPDVTFDGSDAASPSVTVTLTPRNTPGGEYEVPSNAQAKTVTLTGPDRFTEQLHVRLRGRQVKVRWESSSLGTKWQLGKMRLEARKDGRR
jgi:hypothetical protein